MRYVFGYMVCLRSCDVVFVAFPRFQQACFASDNLRSYSMKEKKKVPAARSLRFYCSWSVAAVIADQKGGNWEEMDCEGGGWYVTEQVHSINIYTCVSEITGSSETQYCE